MGIFEGKPEHQRVVGRERQQVIGDRPLAPAQGGAHCLGQPSRLPEIGFARQLGFGQGADPPTRQGSAHPLHQVLVGLGQLGKARHRRTEQIVGVEPGGGQHRLGQRGASVRKRLHALEAYLARSARRGSMRSGPKLARIRQNKRLTLSPPPTHTVRAAQKPPARAGALPDCRSQRS